MSTTATSTNESGTEKPPQYLKVEEIAELLRCSVSQIYAIIAVGKLRCLHVTTGKQGGIRVSREQLDSFLKASEGEG